MSDGKFDGLHQRHRCVRHCGRQKATTGGTWPAAKGVILRQVRCCLWSLFAAPVLRACFDLYHRKEMVSVRKTSFQMLRCIAICRPV